MRSLRKGRGGDGERGELVGRWLGMEAVERRGRWSCNILDIE
jgi:hypothetical protein